MSTRERMVVSTALLVREQGARATSLDDVLEHSGAPRGSVYHHFPGRPGAASARGDRLRRRVRRPSGSSGRRRGPSRAVDALLDEYRQSFWRATSGPAARSSRWPSRRARRAPDLQRARRRSLRPLEADLRARLAASGIEAARADELALLVASARGRADRHAGPVPRPRRRWTTSDASFAIVSARR